MIIKQINNRLYDARNFDEYKNYYAILYNEEKYKILKSKNEQDSYIVYTSYINAQLILDVDYDKETSENIFNIIYGHFYNDQNYFLFKKIKNGRLIGYKVNKCKSFELWHTAHNKLYISNYFDDVQKTLITLNKNANYNINKATTCQALEYIEYSKTDEKLNFKELYNDTYSNELLKIQINNPYIIKAK